ncbi:winged helix-turn-helix transcriptional regulator [Virgibacillus salinus]|uniref:Transcriptional regulator, HxlR family n=1 Tax=Virgibacillus salinus TaxID=553311 RepID=A0A1H1DW38_9BACI|nr:helix-turn-helix domain-containing protein [Virgibacillus salinus]SDQ80705.1 transcriptional regulator, HxlR family [Virgibacillus salinus]
MKVCPYIEASFQILGKKWNGQLIHYLSLCDNGTAHFSDIKHDLRGITSRALSLKLSELAEEELVEKIVENGSPVTISYQLTEKGRSLSNSLKPIQEWAQNYMNVNTPKESEGEEIDKKQ